MQSMSWYFRRLRAMSLEEIAWRVRCSIRDEADRWLLVRRQRLRRQEDLLCCSGQGPKLALNHALAKECVFPALWRKELLKKADKISEGMLNIFDMNDLDLGNPIDWHRDHKNNKVAPMKYSPTIDYRDFRVTGDCKYVWEPNRHHQLVVLARAYCLTGDISYAASAVSQLDDWIQSNPYGIGMNWRSPLELGIRLINLAWTMDLIQGSGLISGAFQERMLNTVFLHLWEISRKYSRGSSANNHLVGEAAGVFVGSSYFPEFKMSPQWHRTSRQILCEEIFNQTYPDGGPREQALGYHQFILHLFLVAGLAARKTGPDFPQSYWNRLETMFEFSASMIEGGDPCNFGDCDDGYVLDLGGRPGDPKPWLAIAAVIFNRPDFAAISGKHSEAMLWLLGPTGQKSYDAILSTAEVGNLLRSRQFPSTGYCLLQHGHRKPLEGLSLMFDCGELGLSPLAAHGHADALNVTLRTHGRDVLVDPGTYDYFSYPHWRQYFRSTKAHNTVVIDGRDQSEPLGLFLWGQRATAKCLEWCPTEAGGKVVGEHDGYSTLPDPVIHRRTVNMDGQSGKIAIQDEIIAKGSHHVAAYFHFADTCCVVPVMDHLYAIDTGSCRVMFRIDPQLAVTAHYGSEDPIAGWISRGYHEKRPCTSLICQCTSQGKLRLDFELSIGPSKIADAGDGEGQSRRSGDGL